MPGDTDLPRAAVLILEDEPLLMMSLVDLAKEAGCEAVEAYSTADAIGILEARTDIRVVVTDLDVGGSVAGTKLAAVIRDRWPPIELVLTSSAPLPPHNSLIPARGVYVNKPFDRREVVQVIRRFTAQPSTALSPAASEPTLVGRRP